MQTRRTLVFTALTAFFTISEFAIAQAAAPPATDPTGIVTDIYARVTKGKGDSGGSFVTDSKASRAKYLSKALNALWAKQDAVTPKGDVAAIDFDPVTNSQDPDVKSAKLATEKQEADKATIAVTMTSHRNDRGNPADNVVRFDFVHEDNTWKIDDIRSAVDGKPWSVRELITQYLKDVKSTKK